MTASPARTSEDESPISVWAPLCAGLAGFATLGLLLGGLTLRLNPLLASDRGDAVLLLIYFVLGYGGLGLALGTASAALLVAVRRFSRHSRRTIWLTRAAIASLLLIPLVYFFLLPDVGIGGDLLSSVIANSPKPLRLLIAFALTTITTFLGLAIWPGIARIGRRLGFAPRTGLLALSGLFILGSLVWAFFARPRIASSAVEEPFDISTLAPAVVADPVVLLCVDGADLQVIEPMIAAGQLPTFARLMREGASGPLATIEPTRSPNIWTSIATGKAPVDHGIQHFVAFRLPGLDHPVKHFPRATGLNFHVIPRLEKLPGAPSIQTPYTSDMRRVLPLWQIAGQFYPVGIYRWLVTWPAEPVNGFNIAASVVADAMQLIDGDLQENGEILQRGLTYPETLQEEIDDHLDGWQSEEESLEPYIGEGQSVPPDHPKLAKIRASFNDPTAHLLPFLVDTYKPRFLAAGFYPVDSFQHFFSTARDKDGPFAEAIAERYRHSDRRLGDFLAALDPTTQTIIISDHGFDFVHHHHSAGPPGLFIGHGSAFAAGRQVENLSIYDIAPMVLHLLGLPLPEDMPGTGTGHYRQALNEAFLNTKPVRKIPSYEPLNRKMGTSEVNPQEDAVKKELESLGYL